MIASHAVLRPAWPGRMQTLGVGVGGRSHSGGFLRGAAKRVASR
jgi:hypothetical protein